MPKENGEHGCRMLDKGGFSLKTIAILFYCSPCGFLYQFGLSSPPKKKKSRNGIKLPYARVSDFGEEKTRSTRASESHSWTGRDVIRSKLKRLSRVLQGLGSTVLVYGVFREEPIEE